MRSVVTELFLPYFQLTANSGGELHGSMPTASLTSKIIAKNIFINARKQANMLINNARKNYYWELDIWIPKFNIGFECQVCFVRSQLLNMAAALKFHFIEGQASLCKRVVR